MSVQAADGVDGGEIGGYAISDRFSMSYLMSMCFL